MNHIKEIERKLRAAERVIAAARDGIQDFQGHLLLPKFQGDNDWISTSDVANMLHGIIDGMNGAAIIPAEWDKVDEAEKLLADNLEATFKIRWRDSKLYSRPTLVKHIYLAVDSKALPYHFYDAIAGIDFARCSGRLGFDAESRLTSMDNRDFIRLVAELYVYCEHIGDVPAWLNKNLRPKELFA